jgi:YYY domain-containing protein
LIAFVQKREDFAILQTINALGWRLAIIAFLAVMLYYPFITNYGGGYTSIEFWKDKRTFLDQYLVVHGIFLFMLGSFLVLQFWNTRARLGSYRMVRLALKEWDRLGRAFELSRLLGRSRTGSTEFSIYAFIIVALLMAVLALLDLAVIAFALPFLVLALALVLRVDLTPPARFVTLLILAGVSMTLMVEFITLKGDIGRMNTVFKFYLQVWVFFGIASATGLALVWERIRVPTPGRAAWWVVLVVLLVGGFTYPLFAGWAKVTDRYPIGDTAKLVPTLNGMDYMKIAVYQDQNQDLRLFYDYDAIQWLRQNVKGSPVLAEANTPLYHWGSRVSIYTGLPGIIGWDWHQRQQRALVPGDVIDKRLQDVKTLFSSPDSNDAVKIIDRYNVDLIYVGEQERAFYPSQGLSKFDSMSSAGLLKTIFDNGAVRIYQVNRGS